MYNTKKYATFSCNHVFWGTCQGKYLLTAFFSKLACGGGSVYQGKKKKKKQCILPQQCQQTRQNFKNILMPQQRS